MTGLARRRASSAIVSPWMAVDDRSPRSPPSTPRPAASRTATPSRSSPSPAPPPTSPASPAASSSSATRSRATPWGSSCRSSRSSWSSSPRALTPAPVRAAGVSPPRPSDARRRRVGQARDVASPCSAASAAGVGPADRRLRRRVARGPSPGRRRRSGRAGSRRPPPRGVAHHQVAGAREQDVAGAAEASSGALELAGEQQAVLGAPGDRHRHAVGRVGRREIAGERRVTSSNAAGSQSGRRRRPPRPRAGRAPRAWRVLRQQQRAPARRCAARAGSRGRSQPRHGAGAAQRRLAEALARARSRSRSATARDARARRRRATRARARRPPPVELPATWASSIPCAVHPVLDARRSAPPTSGMRRGQRRRRAEAGQVDREDLVRRARAASMTGSKACRRLPSPCRSTSGVAAPRAGRRRAPWPRNRTSRRIRCRAWRARPRPREALQEQAKRHLWMHFARLGAFEDGREIPIIARGRGLLRLGRRRQPLPRRLSARCSAATSATAAPTSRRPAPTRPASSTSSRSGPTRTRGRSSSRPSSPSWPPATSTACSSPAAAARRSSRRSSSSASSTSSTASPNKTKIIARETAYHGTTLGRPGRHRHHRAAPALRAVHPRRLPRPEHQPLPAGRRATAPRRWPRRSTQRIELRGARHRRRRVSSSRCRTPAAASSPPEGYFQRVREICDEHDVLLVSDEVICSFGRLGEWFGAQRYGYQPDIITTAKGLTSAYAPMGAVHRLRPHRRAVPRGHDARSSTASRSAATRWRCAVALANIEVFEQEGILDERARPRARVCAAMLDGLRDIPIVGDVRGAGLLPRARARQGPGDQAVASATPRPRTLLRGFLGPELFTRGPDLPRRRPRRPGRPALAAADRGPRASSPRSSRCCGRCSTEAIEQDGRRRMKIGVPTEIKTDEYRVALTPGGRARAGRPRPRGARPGGRGRGLGDHRRRLRRAGRARSLPDADAVVRRGAS